MAMNYAHRRICGSDKWAQRMESVLLPWALDGAELGDDVLEIGPGFGASTRLLAPHVPRLTAVEIDPASVERLQREFGDRATVLRGDASAGLPVPDGAHSSVVCFTMLHHVPSPAGQDRLFASALHALRPGGVFAGSDSLYSLGFRVLHIGDTMVVVDPETLPDRLRRAGFTDVDVTVGKRSFRFRATRPLS